MRTTTIYTPLPAPDSVHKATRWPHGVLDAAHTVLIVAGCVVLGTLLLAVNLIAFPIRVARRLVRR